ncbi:hypothetical protein IH979_00185 [Patescibacteria group bacterium]|nr:hypothetical protein [Patescibacteria group bacterium]
MKKALIIILLIAVAIIVVIVLTTPPPPPTTASLTVSDQELVGNEVVIDAFDLDQPGYVVIHKDVDGAPGPVIGNSDFIQAGSYKNVRVKFDVSEAGEGIFAMLHYDDDGDEEYGFPDEDAPVILEGNVVVKPISFR